MINERVDIEVYGRRLTVELEGLTQLEVHSMALELTQKMASLAKETEIVDSSKLAILCALETLAQLRQLQAQHEGIKRGEERQLEQMIASLQGALSAAA